MTDADTPKIDWRCQLGRHHYIRVVDDKPEVRGQTVLLCTRCGKHEDAPPPTGRSGSLEVAGIGKLLGGLAKRR
jgi:hypothetical protein